MKLPPTSITLRDGQAIELRSADEGEAVAVLAYLISLSGEAPKNLNHPQSFFQSVSVESERVFLRGMNEHPKSFLLSAWDGAAIVGTASVVADRGSFAGHVGELGIGTLRAYHGLGLGRALMERLIDTATSSGVTTLLLRVRTFNVPAIALYEKLGFVRVATLERIVELPDGFADEHMYRRDAH